MGVEVGGGGRWRGCTVLEFLGSWGVGQKIFAKRDWKSFCKHLLLIYIKNEAHFIEKLHHENIFKYNKIFAKMGRCRIFAISRLSLLMGTRQHWRDNVTMFSGHKVVGYCILTIFVVATPSRHRDLNIFRMFCFALWHFCVVAKLNDCRVPSSVI